MCKEAIFKLEDQQLELMEQAEHAQKEVAAATQRTAEAKKTIDAPLGHRGSEANLKKELADLEANREDGDGGG